MSVAAAQKNIISKRMNNVFDEGDILRDYLKESKLYKEYHYSVLSEEMLNYLHSTCLEMFKCIKKVLDENHIKYMIVGGTLLGAATRGGFIPWDDDFDMCIFEEDYNRAIDLLIEQLPQWMVVQCEKTEKKYFHGWIKVRDKNSKVLPDKDGYEYSGVWVDIYCLKKIKQKNINKVKVQEHIDYLRRRYNKGAISKEEYRERLKKDDLRKKILKEKIRTSFIHNDFEVYMIWSASKMVILEEWIFPLKEIRFEKITVTTINRVDEYLKSHYSENYKQNPSDEERNVGIREVQIIK